MQGVLRKNKTPEIPRAIAQNLVCPNPSYALFGQILCRAGSEITLIGPVTVTNSNT
jgi:hypothetical protein